MASSRCERAEEESGPRSAQETLFRRGAASLVYPAAWPCCRAAGGLSGIAAPKSSASSTSSRSGSPHTGSFIPQPKSAVVTRDRTANGDRSRPSSTASASSISHLPVKSAGVPVRQQQTSGAQSNGPANGHLIKGSSHLSSAHNGSARRRKQQRQPQQQLYARQVQVLQLQGQVSGQEQR
ncbi:hypothetical protein HPB48_017350 [Haemaphysalis longicornis]|uniref:Uncharacterized protein n=1 Tax=Haemaphysalis longicornis TaxID=44386 RepID=A0A9J6GUZ1_HAELO|nr:hypothetical protein HPB48_017350 [Haemaphysalis longicornis]